MADKFLQHDGIETGYWSKRKDTFNKEIGLGISHSTGGKQAGTVKPKKKQNTNQSKATVPKNPAPKKAPEKNPSSEYHKKDLDNGRTMYFKGTKLVSEAEFKENAKK